MIAVARNRVVEAASPVETSQARKSIAERQRGLSGSWIIAKGQSGTGKSHELTECWLRSAMMFGGEAICYDPTGDITANVESYKLGYIRRINECGMFSSPTRDRLCRVVDFLRYNVTCFYGMDADEAFKAVAEYISDHGNTGEPRFSFFVDEGAVARKQNGFLESLAPLMRNARGIGYASMHRGMAVPPQLRAVTRAQLLWRSSDGTGDETTEREIASIEGFKYSPVMGDTKPEEQFYRGIRYTANGPEFFEYNPNLAPRPDWMLLPAPPTAIRPRELR